MTTISSSTTSTTAYKVTADTTGALVLQTGATPTTAVTIDTGQRTTFPTTIAVGNATPATSGSGISFPATQSASSDANTLDDYEEGAWTPTVTSGTGSITTVVVGGQYRKVGGLVSLQFTYQITNNGTGAGSITIAGLPFANTTGANVSAGVMREIAVNGQTGSIYFNSTTTLLAVNYVSAYPGGANNYWVGSICYYAT